MTRRPGLARLIPAVATVALLAAACGSDGSTDSALPAPAEASDTADAPDDTSDDAPADQAAADGVPELLQFTAPLVGGGEIDATSTAGTPTAFWFWSPT